MYVVFVGSAPLCCDQVGSIQTAYLDGTLDIRDLVLEGEWGGGACRISLIDTDDVVLDGLGQVHSRFSLCLSLEETPTLHVVNLL